MLLWACLVGLFFPIVALTALRFAVAAIALWPRIGMLALVFEAPRALTALTVTEALLVVHLSNGVTFWLMQRDMAALTIPLLLRRRQTSAPA